MGISCRRFLIAQDGTLFRLSNTKFDRMLRDPMRNRLPLFAGQRVRMAQAIVELTDRAAVRILRKTLAMLVFDGAGAIDSGRFERQQFALAGSALAAALIVRDLETKVVDAADRFVAQGGSWTPSIALNGAIEEAALGRVRCRRL